MTVLLVNSLYDPNILGGAEISTQILAESLGDKYNVYVLTTGKKTKVLRKNGVVVIYKKIPHIFNRIDSSSQGLIKKVLWRIFELFNIYPYFFSLKLFKKIKPNVVHTNNIASFTPLIWKAASEASAKVVHTTRDYYLICAKSSMFKKNRSCTAQCLKCTLYTLPFRCLYKYVDQFVFISEYMKRIHANSRGGIKGYVVYNSIGKKNNKTNKKINEFKIGYIGSINHIKGVDRIISIANSLKVKALIAGNIEDESIYKEIKKSEYVTWIGFVDKSLFFEQIQLLIHLPRWEEPMGRTVIESHSYGVPVISLRKGGITELITENENGYLVDEEDCIRQSIDIILSMKGDIMKYKKMSLECLESSKKFSVDNYVNSYTELYR